MGAEVLHGAAAEIVDQQQPAFLRQTSEFVQRGFLGEAGDAEVALVDLQQHARGRGDGTGVVGQPGLVGGAHLDQPGAALLDHVRDAEPAADLHQFAARHDDVAASG